MSDTLVEKKIKRRKVFYLAGYDPRGFRFYYGNLKTQSKKFCNRENITITISEKQKISSFETTCTLSRDDITTDYSFLHWDDFVKQSWIKSYAQLFFKGLTNYAMIFKKLCWHSTFKLNHSPVITLFYPFLTLVIPPALLTLVLSLIYGKNFIWIIWLALSILLWIKCLPKVNSLWLLRFFIFNRENFILYNKDYDKRAKEFATIIAQSFSKDYDEILLICHSNGSIASIPILNHMTQFSENFKVLSLGHCLPLITINTQSTDYLDIVQKVSQKNIMWYDIGFPPDGACYAKTNPFITYDNLNPNMNIRFSSISPQYFKYYNHDDYEKLRRDKFKLHFNYLCTYDKPSPTEFIDILTSDKLLEDRFY